MQKVKLVHYKNSSVAELAELVEDDITYSVLHRILKGICTDIYTDHDSVIICYSSAPYPIWVWCREPRNDAVISAVVECIRTNYPPGMGYGIIVSHDVLRQLQRTDSCFASVSLKMELLSYRLLKINDIERICEGYAGLASYEELDIIAHIFEDMHYEMEGLRFGFDECRKKALSHINDKQLYTWKNERGELVSLAAKRVDGKRGSISCVYTVPSERRKGYAINLVHKVASDLISDGITPILYTNGGYNASNECYRKIGFEQVGSLCNVEMRGDGCDGAHRGDSGASSARHTDL